MSRQNHSILKLICLLNHFHFRQKETEFLRGTSDKKETGSVGFCRTQDQNFYLIWSIWNYVEIKCPRCSCSSFKMSFFIANRHIYVLQTWWNKFNQTRKKLSSDSNNMKILIGANANFVSVWKQEKEHHYFYTVFVNFLGHSSYSSTSLAKSFD